MKKFLIFDNYGLDQFNYYKENLEELGLDKANEEITDEEIWEQVRIDLDISWEDLESDIKKFDDTYIFTGKVSTWRGSFIGGKIVTGGRDLLNTLVGYDYIKLYETSYGKAFVELSHHDGTHIMEIRKLNSKGYDYYNNHYDKETIDLVQILSNSKYSNNLRLRKELGWI